MVAFVPVSGISISTRPVVAGAGSAGSGGADPGNGTGGQSTPTRHLKVTVGGHYLAAQACVPLMHFQHER